MTRVTFSPRQNSSYLGHGSQQVFDVGQLTVVVGQDGFDGVHQELQGLAAGLQLLLSLLLTPTRPPQLLLQQPLGTAQPIRAADG